MEKVGLEKKQKIPKKVSIKNKNEGRKILANSLVFYNKELKKKHIIIFIVMLIVFAGCFSVVLENTDAFKQILTNGGEVGTGYWAGFLKNNAIIPVLTILSGMVPYVYIPFFISLVIPYYLACNLSLVSSSMILFASIAAVLKIFVYSLLIAMGMYYCKCSTMKYRYQSKGNISFDDIKKVFYEKTDKKEKLAKLEEKIMKKKEKQEKWNVTISYKQMVIIAFAGAIVLSILSLLSGV